MESVGGPGLGALRIKLVELNRFGETVAVFYGDCKRERRCVESWRRRWGNHPESRGAILGLEAAEPGAAAEYVRVLSESVEGVRGRRRAARRGAGCGGGVLELADEESDS